ncbi:envelope integrity protein Cei [Prauserella oleivorans]|uniref:Envelope integrity protein Cei n=1 Tax=Prauserella oleivorans TaxID=1478153 RepID=A0ABW5W778_9PSEU
MSGTGGFRRNRIKPYRKYKPLPALIVLGVLGVVAAFVWVNVVTSVEDLDEAIRCQPAARPPQGVTYTSQPHDALADTQPVPPNRVAVRVLNASGLRGEAAMTTEALRQLGFTQLAEPANDDSFPAGEADCHGQIRYGTNGEGAARTLQLIDPCLQLVNDGRRDATVDLAVGTTFNDVRPTREALDVLEQLNRWSAENSAVGGSEQSAGGQGPIVDQDLLAKTAPSHC